MPETRGLPEPEPTQVERATVIAAEAIAGQGVVRRVVLYAVAVLLIVTPLAPLAVVPVVLLMATDKGLS